MRPHARRMDSGVLLSPVNVRKYLLKMPFFFLMFEFFKDIHGKT